MQKNFVSELRNELERFDAEDALYQILEHEKKHRGVDWVAFYTGTGEQDTQVSQVLSSLNLSGDVNEFRKDPLAFLVGNTNAENTNANLHIGNTEEDGRMIDYIQSLRGEEMRNYVVYLTQKLQLAEQHTSATMIAVDIAATGIIAIGGLWLKGTIKALIAGKKILAACAAGISSLGITAAITFIGVLVVAILIPFFIFMDKKAEMLALIINRTPQNVNMTYYFKHGKCVSKPAELIPESRKLVSITGCKKIDEDEICSAGLLFVSKMNKALIGVEGACKLVFEDRNTVFPSGVHIGFSVPLAAGSNSCYISWDDYASEEAFFNSNYRRFVLELEKKDSKRLIQARVSRAGGGEPVMVAVVQEK